MYWLRVLSVICFFHIIHALLLDGQSDSNLLQQVTDLQHRLSAVEEKQCGCSKETSVSFMAQLSANIENPAPGGVVVFDSIITNVGSAYNNVHGIFTAPVNGTYFFSLDVSYPYDAAFHKIRLYIMKNNHETGLLYFDGNKIYWLRRSTSVVIQLVQGDEVWVQVNYIYGHNVIEGCCFHSLFEGFLIRAD